MHFPSKMVPSLLYAHVFNIQKSLLQRDLQLDYLECEEQSPFVKVEFVICHLFPCDFTKVSQ